MTNVADAVKLDLPADKAQVQRTREEPARPHPARRLPAWLTGGRSAWKDAPPALAGLWDDHHGSANDTQVLPLQVARHSWGLVHTLVIALPAYALVQATRTWPRAVLLAALIVSARWWL